MTNDRIPLEALIQSEYVREYVQKTDITFTDAQKATLLANSWIGNLHLEEQFRYLHILRDDTTDTDLKTQITTYLDRMERRCKKLKKEESRINAIYENTEAEQFVNMFFQLPNPFERGDIVRRVGSNKDEDFGIVETTQKQCLEDYERFKNKPEFYSEFGDDRIRVVFLNDDGTFSHAHIIPMYLEKYDPEWSYGDTTDASRDNLLIAASWMYTGEGSLDELEICAEEYRKEKRNNWRKVK